MSSEGRPAVVTLAALYGAGGSIIGPRVAERLGVPFLDRRIPEAVAKETGLSDRAVEEVDENPRDATSRVLATLGRVTTAGGSEGVDRDQAERQQRLEDRPARRRHLGTAPPGGGEHRRPGDGHRLARRGRHPIHRTQPGE